MQTRCGALGAVCSLWGLLGLSCGLWVLPAPFQLFGCSPISWSSRAINCLIGSSGLPTASMKYHAAAPPAAFIPLYLCSIGFVLDAAVLCSLLMHASNVRSFLYEAIIYCGVIKADQNVQDA